DQGHLADDIARLRHFDQLTAGADLELAVEHDVHRVARRSLLADRLASLEPLRFLGLLEKVADIHFPPSLASPERRSIARRSARAIGPTSCASARMRAPAGSHSRSRPRSGCRRQRPK